jgi:hypothetical protein
MSDPGKNREDRNEGQKWLHREGQPPDTASEGLQIDQDPAFQELAWKLQRFGWWVMLLSVVAAILGYLGPGLMTDSQVGSGSVRLEYNRFIHYGAVTRLRIHLKPTTHRKDHIDLQLNHQYLDRFQVQQVTPYPEGVRAPLVDGVVYTFAVGSNGDSVVGFDLLPLYPGLLRGQVEALDERVDFKQFVLP